MSTIFLYDYSCMYICTMYMGQVNKGVCGCLVTWFCYQMIAKPGNKRATSLWLDPYIYIYIYIWVRSRNCGFLVTWFCYQLIAKPGNKTATVPWPDPYIYIYNGTEIMVDKVNYYNKIFRMACSYLVYEKVKMKCCYCHNPFVTECVGGCQYDNSQCLHWWQGLSMLGFSDCICIN